MFRLVSYFYFLCPRICFYYSQVSLWQMFWNAGFHTSKLSLVWHRPSVTRWWSGFKIFLSSMWVMRDSCPSAVWLLNFHPLSLLCRKVWQMVVLYGCIIVLCSHVKEQSLMVAKLEKAIHESSPFFMTNLSNTLICWAQGCGFQSPAKDTSYMMGR